MSATTKADGETKELPCVKEYTFYDAGSDYFMHGGVFWDSESESWDTIHAPEGMGKSWKLVDAPAHVKEKWEVRQTAKAAARDRFKSLFDRIQKSPWCPVCEKDTMVRVRNPPKPLRDKSRLGWCPECNTNTWYGEGLIGNFWAAIAVGDGFSADVTLADGLGNDCSVRYKRGPGYYGKKLKEFDREFAEAKADAGF